MSNLPQNKVIDTYIYTDIYSTDDDTDDLGNEMSLITLYNHTLPTMLPKHCVSYPPSFVIQEVPQKLKIQAQLYTSPSPWTHGTSWNIIKQLNPTLQQNSHSLHSSQFGLNEESIGHSRNGLAEGLHDLS